MRIKIKPLLLCLPIYYSNCLGQFTDRLEGSGITFKHINGMDGKMLMPEIMGSGAAFFDYDNDGDMDLYLVQSGNLKDTTKGISKYSDKLYRNDTTKPDQPKFVNVTKQAKINSTGYGMGVASGDLNNDGYIDLFIANYGTNLILINKGDGTFFSSPNSIESTNQKWSIGASIADHNADGFLDIYSVNYIEFSLTKFIKKCRSFDGSPAYCAPQSYSYDSDNLYINNKNGTFANISDKVGLNKIEAPGLGVVAADFNGDMKIDYYVANDGVNNHYWLNQGNNVFKEAALENGLAVNMNGEPEASMGVVAADYDNDGDIDLFMTHLTKQTNTLYVNNGKGWFTDLTVMKKLSSSSLSSTGFGTIWFDYDNDGLLDIFSANGAIIKLINQVKAKDPFPYKSSNQLWKNIDNGSYQEVSDKQNSSFLKKTVSRGAAVADFDNDGDLDILVTNNNGVPQFLVNELNNKNNWIGIKAFRKDLNRVDIGAKITLVSGNQNLLRIVKTDGSYASSHDNRVLIGLGSNNAKVNVTIQWTNGETQVFKQLELNRYHMLSSIIF